MADFTKNDIQHIRTAFAYAIDAARLELATLSTQPRARNGEAGEAATTRDARRHHLRGKVESWEKTLFKINQMY